MKKALVSKYRSFIELLAKLNYSSRKKLIKNLKKPHILCLSEIFNNFLKNKIEVGKPVLKRLSKYRALLHTLACKKKGISLKKQILTSKRGGNLLGILLPIAITLISKLFNRE